jgi:hypothetical protein
VQLSVEFVRWELAIVEYDKAVRCLSLDVVGKTNDTGIAYGGVIYEH